MELRSGHRLLQEQRAGQPVGPLPPAARPAFEEGCRLLFSRWTALQLAVENEWGGAGSRDKEAWLLRESVGWFYHGRDHYADELEEELSDALVQDFNVEAEDNSPSEVATAMVELFQQCMRGDFSGVETLRVQAAQQGGAAARSRRQVVDRDGTDMGADASSSSSGGSGSGSESDDAMDEDVAEGGGAAAAGGRPRQPPPPAVVDEEGFTVVQKGRRGAQPR